jgi:hypothetical protein
MVNYLTANSVTNAPERTTLGQFPPQNNPWVNFSQKTTPGSVFPENNFRYIAQHKYTIMAFPTQNK